MNNTMLPLGCQLKGKEFIYYVDSVLGQGSFGITYLGRAQMKLQGPLGTIETEVKVAIKEFFMRDVNGRSETRVTAISQSVNTPIIRKSLGRKQRI